MCSKENKVPFNEKLFLEDQRTLRNMAIGPVDRLTTGKNVKRINRKLRRSFHQATGGEYSGSQTLKQISSEDSSTNTSDISYFES